MTWANDRWSRATLLPFRIGRMTDKTLASRRATDTDSLPWLILVTPQGRVAAEGFSLEDLADKMHDIGQ